MPLAAGRYSGPLYRALNPVYARDPLSGRGAELHGGRFNAKKTPALYTALDPATALREANQVGNLQPTILVSYVADIGPIFDTRERRALTPYGMSADALADPAWRTRILDGWRLPTREFTRSLISDGFAGLLIRNFAKGTSASDLDIVMWHWTGGGCSLDVFGDKGRLSRI